MIEYITKNGWKYAGNCATCNGGQWYMNDKYAAHPNRYRLKLIGNQWGMVERNENPSNHMDFKIIDRFDARNYEQVLTKYFNGENTHTA